MVPDSGERHGGAPPTPVSIVVVSWNSREMLLELVPSLLRVSNAEVLIVDNDSSDGSAETVEAAFPEARTIRCDRNQGFAAGVNTGLRHATHPLVLLVNPDVEVDAAAVDRLRLHADAHPEAGVLGPRVLNEDGSLQYSCWRFPSLLNLFLTATYLYKAFPDSSIFNRERLAGRIREPAPVDAVSGCFFMLRAELVDKIGPFDDDYFMYFEETDFCLRAVRDGFEVHYVPTAEVVHAGGKSAERVRRRTFLEYRRSMVRFFVKHRGQATAEVARLLMVLFLALRVPYWGVGRLMAGGTSESGQMLSHYLAGLRFLLRPLSTILDGAVEPAEHGRAQSRAKA